jgi:hypothetical protein
MVFAPDTASRRCSIEEDETHQRTGRQAFNHHMLAGTLAAVRSGMDVSRIWFGFAPLSSPERPERPERHEA